MIGTRRCLQRLVLHWSSFSSLRLFVRNAGLSRFSFTRRSLELVVASELCFPSPVLIVNHLREAKGFVCRCYGCSLVLHRCQLLVWFPPSLSRLLLLRVAFHGGGGRGSPTTTKTFAQALSNLCIILTSKLSKPCLKGDQVSIKITETGYLAGVLDCQNVLHGRFTLLKGSSHVRMQDLKERIVKFWKTNEQWSMVSLVQNRKVQPVVLPSGPVSVADVGNKVAIDEDPLIEYMIRAKEVAFNVVGDAFPKGEIPNIFSGVVDPVQMEDVRAKELTTAQIVDQQTPNLGHIGSGSGIDDIGHKMYTDKEENVAAINFLRNCVANREEPFTEVLFKGNRKKGKPVITPC
ncbi:hypothetical protein TSUD_399940 [Trifolium subterraneum]|uniref:Uncharacterized protein n=1 Tax=Trifolium subterraneum TaxID=3900 RepID=A0A2Z6P509_TRISU|nr:hypothetical protein TSUD_399940 [Trifolium subterraneum]